MPTRRTYLAVLFAAGTTAGCTQYDVVSGDETDDRDAELDRLRSIVEEQRDTIDDLESELGERSSNLRSRNRTVEDLRAERRRLRADLEAQRRRHEAELATAGVERVVGLYRLGHEGRSLGVDAFETGRERWNDGDYLEAVGPFSRGEGAFEHAARVFERAGEAAETEGIAEADSAVETATTFCERMADACAGYADAAAAVVNRDLPTANDRFTAAREQRDDAADLDVVGPDEFAELVQ